MAKIKPILPRIGGKARIAQKIVPHLTKVRFNTYIEPFFGSGAIYFRLYNDGYFEQFKAAPNKYNYPRIVLNDADRWVTNLFKYCRDKPDELARLVALTPFSRDVHVEAIRAIAANDDDNIELVRQYLIAHHQGYAIDTERWASCERRTNGTLDKLSKWQKLPDRILAVVAALKEVYIENSDFEPIINRWDGDNACIYCDPPYIGVEHYYDEKFGAKDHDRLANVLNECKGHVVVSYYPDPLLDKLYPKDKWNRVEFGHYTSSNANSDRPKRTELLLVKKSASPDRINTHGQLALI